MFLSSVLLWQCGSHSQSSEWRLCTITCPIHGSQWDGVHEGRVCLLEVLKLKTARNTTLWRMKDVYMTWANCHIWAIIQTRNACCLGVVHRGQWLCSWKQWHVLRRSRKMKISKCDYMVSIKKGFMCGLWDERTGSACDFGCPCSNWSLASYHTYFLISILFFSTRQLKSVTAIMNKNFNTLCTLKILQKIIMNRLHFISWTHKMFYN